MTDKKHIEEQINSGMKCYKSCFGHKIITHDKEMTNKQIEQVLNELVKQGYMRKLKGDNYKLTNKGKGYAECLIKIMQGE